MEASGPRVARVPFSRAVRFWAWLGFVNFGGPAGQIALMHAELVERRGWVSEERFLHALNFAMLLPGPEAHQLAIYLGWLLSGTGGAMAAGVLFVLPAFVLIVALSWVYAVHGDIGLVAGVFEGLAWAVVGVVVAALVRLAPRTLVRPLHVAIAAGAFLALFVLGIVFPLVVVAAGLIGLAVGSPAADGSVPSAPTTAPGAPASDGPAPPSSIGGRPTWGRAGRTLAVGLAVWLVPLAAVAIAAGPESVLAEEAVFFSVAALVTFGGAYALLAYVNQAAVLRFGWLTPGEMAVGLSLAETTPGPLILVVVFVGFVGAFREPGGLAPEVAGVAGALVVAWATFVPSFLWIFLGAPSVERLRGNRRLAGALAAITAAVVGVIADLALVFATTVLFDRARARSPFGHEISVPDLASADALAIAVAAASAFALVRFRVNVVWVVLGAGAAGLLRALG